MKYHMRSKLFKIKEDFWINNENDDSTFFVDNKLLSFGLKFNIQQNKKIIYEVKEQVLNFLSKYEIYENNKVIAKVNEKLTFLKTKLDVNSKYGDFNIEGSIFDYNYSIYKGSKVVARIEKGLFSMTDRYTVDIDFEDEAFILALVVIIDNIIDKKKSK